SGGQIMPPVMGVAAFVIADSLGVPYSEVALAAAIPAVLFYLSIFLQIDLEAGKDGLKGIPADQIPGLRSTFLGALVAALPVILLLYLLFFEGMYASRAAVIVTVLSLPLFSILRSNRRHFLKRVIDALE